MVALLGSISTVRPMNSSTPVMMPPVRSRATPSAECVPPPNTTYRDAAAAGQCRKISRMATPIQKLQVHQQLLGTCVKSNTSHTGTLARRAGGLECHSIHLKLAQFCRILAGRAARPATPHPITAEQAHSCLLHYSTLDPPPPLCCTHHTTPHPGQTHSHMPNPVLSSLLNPRPPDTAAALFARHHTPSLPRPLTMRKVMTKRRMDASRLNL
jgi:hypothetical protein